MQKISDKSLREIEVTIKKGVRRGRIEKILLTTIQSAGLLSIAILAPNALGAMAKLGLLPTSPKKLASARQSVRRAQNRLEEKGLIIRKNGKFHITQKGERILDTISENTIKPTRKKWDNKWRIVIFDIKEKQKKKRDMLRRYLLNAGFFLLQNSVWIHPHPRDEIIVLLKNELLLGKDLLYIVADEIEGDNILKRHFNLPV